MPAEPTDAAGHRPVHSPADQVDPLGLTRPVHLRPTDRLLGLLSDLGITPQVAALGVGVGLVALLGWYLLRSPAPEPAEAGVPLAPAAAPASRAGAVAVPTSVTGGPVLAHAAGAVRRPGLYELAAGDRVADLLTAAGGPLPAADLDRINLAAPVTDGTQVIVPRRGEPVTAVPAPADATSASSTEAPVNINLAGPEELETLPGVGPATAAAIIEYRDAAGPFASVEQLIDVSGIGEAKLAALIDLVTV